MFDLYDKEYEDYLDDSEYDTEIDDGTVLGPEFDWFNEYGADASSLIQTTVIDYELASRYIDEPDMIPVGLMEQEMIPDELDDMDVLNIQLEMEAGEEPVPYEYRYWEHRPDEFPDDAPSAPPEPGDVDPNTGEPV